MSTHLYHGQRLSRDHLLEIAAHGFEAVELFATRTHFDYHNPSAVADLQQWLAEAGLELHSVHAPVGDSFIGGRWGAPLTWPAPTPRRARAAMAEAERALHIARRIPLQVLVVHLGCAAHAARGAGRQQPRRARAAASRNCCGSPSRSASASPSK